MKKKTVVSIIVLAVVFLLLIPLQVFLENKADAVNTQLLLQQASDNANYTAMMTTKSWLKVANGLIVAGKCLIGLFYVLIGVKEYNEIKKQKVNSNVKEGDING